LLGHSFPSSTISLLLLYVNSSLVSTETLQRKLIIKTSNYLDIWSVLMIF
jgi:hypothetical protein